MTSVALDPFPFDLVTARCFIKPLPPIVVRLALPGAAHGFDHVPRVRQNFNAARLPKVLKAYGGGCDLRLLVCRVSKIGPDRLPYTLEPKHRHSGRTRISPPVAEARAVADDGDLFHVYAPTLTSWSI